MRLLCTLVVFTLMVTGLIQALGLSPARACSCAPPDADLMLEESDAAFIGSPTVRAMSGPSGADAQDAQYTFAVDEWIKGDHGSVVDVQAPSDDGTCGFSVENGGPIAVFARDIGGILESDLCRTARPDVLLAVVGRTVEATTSAPTTTPPAEEAAEFTPESDAPGVGLIAAVAVAGLLVGAVAARRRR